MRSNACKQRKWIGCVGVVLLALNIMGWNHCYSAMAQQVSRGKELPTGFVSIDCGGSNYTDALGILWTPDSYYLTVTLSANTTTRTVQPPPDSNVTGMALSQQPYTTIRYFVANRNKYCYSLPTLPNISSYLVRASFWAGSTSIPPYPGPRFNYEINFTLLINSDEWANVSISLPQLQVVVHEINLQTNSSSIAVCLSGRGDPPFISSLELRPLNESMNLVQCMSQTGLAMRTVHRINYGAPPVDPAVRFPDDFVDRVWISDTATPRISTALSIASEYLPDQPPEAVLRTAHQSPSPTTTLNMNLRVDNTHSHSYFFLLYLAEIDPLVNASGQRVFDIAVNGQLLLPEFDLLNLAGLRHYVGAQIQPSRLILASAPYVDFRFSPTATSQSPPFLNALELFQSLDKPLSLGTSAGDVFAINNITASFVDLSSYTGDPCLPSAYAYPWLNCTSATPPRIYVLALSNYGLVGAIPESINELTGLVDVFLDGNELEGSIPDLRALASLQILNLSNNRLSGNIPDLSSLQNLKYLYLQDNNLSGQIPTPLLERTTLHINYSGNPHLWIAQNKSFGELSQTTPKSLHTSLIIGLVISLLVVLIGITLVMIYCLKVSHVANKWLTSRSTRGHQQHLECAIQHIDFIEASNMATIFSYRDIELATNGFRKRIGEGGFGPVYEGELKNGRRVAIKILSRDSKQGSREFLNEVSLLSRVHHKNVLELLGYCTEQKFILVYEYMSNGSLQNLLYGPSSSIAPLSWETRLKIMVNAAQGLEYLHHGCNPPIIHRDVKSSNILLNEKMEGKIGDFGISRVRYDTNELATNLVGSLGYLDPEYASTLRLTIKADTYGFGVLLLEAICARPPIIRNNSMEEVHIKQWVQQSIDQGIIKEVIDKCIHNDYDMSSMWKAMQLGMMCVQYEGEKRPMMSEVYSELQEALCMEMHRTFKDQHEPTDLLEEVEPR